MPLKDFKALVCMSLIYLLQAQEIPKYYWLNGGLFLMVFGAFEHLRTKCSAFCTFWNTCQLARIAQRPVHPCP